MQTTSATWKALWAGGNARLETVAVIAGEAYDAISAPVIDRALMQGGLSIGNAVSATCRFSVLTDAEIPKSAEVVVRMRLTDGEAVSEWLPAGTFYISHRTRDPVTGLLTLECYDALLKANAQISGLMPWTADTGEAMTTETGDALYLTAAWPRPMAALARDIALLLGLELDGRTRIKAGEDYCYDLPEGGASLRDALSAIATANGGNWIVTPENRLRLVPLTSAALAARASENAADVAGIVGKIDLGATAAITGIRYAADGQTCVVGSDAGIVIDAEVSAAVAQALAAQLLGMTHQSYSLEGALYDPAAELGDYVRSREDVAAVLCAERATLGAAFRGDVSAPEPGELSDEYPYIGRTARALEALRGSVARKADVTYVDAGIARANEVIAALDAALDQKGVLDRLTGGGAAQGVFMDEDRNLYVNASYIQSGILDAGLIRAGTVTDATGQNYWVLDGNASEFVTRRGVVGEFTLANGELTYGAVGAGNTGIKINRMGFTESYYDPAVNNTRYAVLTNGQLRLGRYELGYVDISAQGQSYGMSLWCYNGSLYALCIQVKDNPGDQGITIGPSYPVTVTKSLTVNGTKSRQVSTDQYANRLLYCYETPSPMFGDVGEGVIAEDGKCYIPLDAIFAQTIGTDQYQVFLQRYGPGECWVAERRPGYFIVEGAPGLRFGWELKAKQRDFDQLRLERNDTPFSVPVQSYGAEAAKHMENLNKGRIES